DQNGCSGTGSKTVHIMDISSGKKGANILVCHNGNTIAVATPAVPAHLNHGDMLGSCDDQGAVMAREMVVEDLAKDALSVKVLSNPSPDYFELQIIGKAGNIIQLKVYDLQGRIVETKSSLSSNQTLRLGIS